MKKMLMAAMMVAVLMAVGCGGGEQAKTEGTVPKAGAATEIKSEKEKVEIHRVRMDRGQPYQDKEVVVKGKEAWSKKYYLKSTGEELWDRTGKGDFEPKPKLEGTSNQLTQFKTK